jgi:hypothetical protein
MKTYHSMVFYKHLDAFKQEISGNWNINFRSDYYITRKKIHLMLINS